MSNDYVVKTQTVEMPTDIVLAVSTTKTFD